MPGDPVVIGQVALSWGVLAEDADAARVRIMRLLADDAVTAWVGKGGDAFRSHSLRLPDQLVRAADSYRQAAAALSLWAGDLAGCQGSADRGLALAVVARAELATANAALVSARANRLSAQVAADTALHAAQRAGDSLSVVVDPNAVSATNARAGAADSAVVAAQAGVDGALARWEAARRIVTDAVGLRDQRADVAGVSIRAAASAGIAPDSFWHRVGDVLGTAWRVVITVAKVVVAVGGVIAMIVGGPIAWLVVAAAVLVLADTIAQGRAGQGGVLGCCAGRAGLHPLHQRTDHSR